MDLGKINIAVDGHSSCGKSTLAKGLAAELGYIYIDSGAMYRAVTLFCINEGIIVGSELNKNQLLDSLDKFSIDFQYDLQSGNAITLLNGENVEDRIREMEISQRVGLVSPIREVRQKLIRFQQETGRKKGVVMDGRDIGSVVFPDAELKLFMTADVEVRAERRYKELLSKGMPADFDEVKANLVRRDAEDSTRKENPLIVADDARIIDNSNIDQEQQMELALSLAQEKITHLQP